MTEERKHEIEDIIDNALTKEDCRAWAEGNCTEHVKQLMEEHHIKQLNIWDDVNEIVDFDSDESGNVFDAGCPVNVEVEENPVQILRKKIKDEYQIFFDRGVQTRKFNPDYNQELINRNFGNEDDRTEKQEKELFFFYAGYNAESLREKERWSEVH